MGGVGGMGGTHTQANAVRREVGESIVKVVTDD
jgi:hypothetical protein